VASFLQIGDLMGLHPAEQRRLVRRALREIKGDLRSIDLEHVEGVLAVCGSSHGHHRLVVPGVDILRSFDTLRLIPLERAKGEERDYRVPVQFGQGTILPFGTGRIAVNWGDSESQNCVNFNKAEDVFSGTVKLERGTLSPSELESLLYIRNWQPGDEIQLPGQAAKKLKFLFQEQRVLLWERKHWPVMVFRDRIVWTRQFGCAAHSRDSGENDSGEHLRTLHISYCAER
jgi:tRNA(Ile)-lysidine synthase